MVLPSEVGGGVSVEEHLMKVDDQTAQTRLALFGSDLKVLEASVCFLCVLLFSDGKYRL